MGIPVKLEAFEGPLDLLLHLIDKNKINIYDCTDHGTVHGIYPADGEEEAGYYE